MKKILAVILALMMLTTTGLCLAEAAEPECVQIWDLVAMFVDGVEQEEGTYPFISFYIYDDATFTSEVRGLPNAEGTVETSHDPAGYILTMGDQTGLLVYDEETGCLYMENEALGQKGVFMLRANMSAELNAESIDEFQGTWRVNAIIKSGSLVHMDSAAGQAVLNDANATDPIMVIEGSKVNLFGILEGEAELADGRLAVTFPYGESIITLTEGDSIIMDILGENQMISKMFADKE